MKALSLTQPWASLVAVGAKTIETRSWSTRYRGPLAIHAAKGLGPGGRSGFRDLCESHPFRGALVECYPVQIGPVFWVASDDLPLGAFVAVAELVDVAPIGSTWPMEVWTRFREAPDEEAFGDYSDGRFAWLLDNVVALPFPVPCRGALGVWNVPAEHLCRSCGKLLRLHDDAPFAVDSDCGGDCWGCVRRAEAAMA